MRQKKKIILLAGPTASGKSKLAIKLAKYLDGVIINADSMQVYREISILTSRPDRKDIKKIKHLLYGFCSAKKVFSTGAWLKMAIKLIRDQWKKKKVPIFVGGTGLYFKALTDGLAEVPHVPNDLRIKIRILHQKIGQKNFFEKLIQLDPLAKKFILPTDSQRSMRAYEVKKLTNKSLFNLIKKTKPKFKKNIFDKFFINIPRELLHKKIEDRVERMFKDGAIKEVQKFMKTKVYKELSSSKIIGIKEIESYLRGTVTLNEAKELIKIKTRQYAKRQFTWSRGHMKSWEMIYTPNINDLLKKIINKIS